MSKDLENVEMDIRTRRLDLDDARLTENTRAMASAALSGQLDEVPMETDPIFRFRVPSACPGVPSEVLQPANTWPDPDAYQRQARELAQAFAENFEQCAAVVSEDVRAAGPRTD
jgi:phosphoenolpyruvate carboxykinase (ATP)